MSDNDTYATFLANLDLARLERQRAALADASADAASPVELGELADLLAELEVMAVQAGAAPPRHWVRLVLDFYVDDPAVTIAEAEEMYQAVWNGGSLTELGDDVPLLVRAVAEQLLHSNPAIGSYDEYGLELIDTSGTHTVEAADTPVRRLGRAERPDSVFVAAINFALLAEQKATLEAVLAGHTMPAYQRDNHLGGLLGLIDDLQHYAVDVCGLPADDVFGGGK